MKKSDRIRVLILEDEPPHIGPTKAGLLPKAPKGLEEVGLDIRVQLAEDNLDIDHARSIEEFFSLLQSFKPDILILDIVLKGNQSFEFDNHNFEDGIDVYRYIKKKHPEIEAILFSLKSTNTDIYERLEEEEDKCIPKSKTASGIGYENLALKISANLKKVVTRIVQNPSVLPSQKNAIEDTLVVNQFENITKSVFLLGERKIELGNLLLYCSYPTWISNGKSKAPGLIYTKPNDEIFALLRQRTFRGGEKYRAQWKADHIQRAISDYERDFRSIWEEDYVIPGINKIISLLLNNTPNKPQDLFSKLRYGNWRIIEYTTSKLQDENTEFLQKFLNLLVTRRTLFFIETFMQEYVDNGAGTLKFEYNSFFRHFVIELLTGLKGKIASSRQNLVAIELGLGFNLKPNDHKDRQRVIMDRYPILKCEHDWLMEKKCKSLKEELKKTVLRISS